MPLQASSVLRSLSVGARPRLLAPRETSMTARQVRAMEALMEADVLDGAGQRLLRAWARSRPTPFLRHRLACLVESMVASSTSPGPRTTCSLATRAGWRSRSSLRELERVLCLPTSVRSESDSTSSPVSPPPALSPEVEALVEEVDSLLRLEEPEPRSLEEDLSLD